MREAGPGFPLGGPLCYLPPAPYHLHKQTSIFQSLSRLHIQANKNGWDKGDKGDESKYMRASVV